MGATPALRLIADTPATALRRLIGERDAITADLARIDAAIAVNGRMYADERGERPLPRIERLRRELLA